MRKLKLVFELSFEGEIEIDVPEDYPLGPATERGFWIDGLYNLVPLDEEDESKRAFWIPSSKICYIKGIN